MGQNRPPRRFSLARLTQSRFAATLAALALAIQCFVVQPHVDGPNFAPASAAAVATADHADQHGLTCLICEAAAVSRAAITPTPPPIGLVAATLQFTLPTPTLAVRETRPTLPWQSRAPPSFA